MGVCEARVKRDLARPAGTRGRPTEFYELNHSTDTFSKLCVKQGRTPTYQVGLRRTASCAVGDLINDGVSHGQTQGVNTLNTTSGFQGVNLPNQPGSRPTGAQFIAKNTEQLYKCMSEVVLSAV